MSALSPEAEHLRERMSGLCRRAYDQDWADHLEYSLWHAVVQGPMNFGRIHLDAGIVDELRELADACGGWIQTWRDGSVECVALADWQDRYAANVDPVRMDRPVPPPGMA